ncbi:MAG: M20 family metallopeptidase [Deltaproteobacteria bacterium]|nr:M20 family metallopeptidase [Deltaproteobacteria bacterium]
MRFAQSFRPLRIFLVLSFIGILLATSAWGDSAKIISAIDAAGDSCKVVSQKIHEWKEQGQQEFKSSALLMEELRKLGYTVTGDLKAPEDLVKGGILKTAFKAELQGKGPGPTITIMLEYDALANGHSCGHNLIATSGLLAAAGLAKVMADTPGRVMVIGTPDEERGSRGMGKVGILEGGHFDGTDVALITHGGDRWSLDQRFLANKRTFFAFRGKSAHAAMAPHTGVNALRAVITMMNGVDSIREHLRQDVRIHGIITKGGAVVNVVPDFAEAEFSVRALDTATMEDAFKKVVNCAKGAELISGAKLEFKEPRVYLTSGISVPPLNAMLLNQIKALGVAESEIKDFNEFASSDLGRVGYTYPTVNLWFKIAKEGVSLHSDAMREAAASEEGWKATLTAGKAIALTAYDLLTHPEKVKTVQESFQQLKAKEGK